MSIWKYRNISFDTKLERDSFIKGYECVLRTTQKHRRRRGKEWEAAIPFGRL